METRDKEYRELVLKGTLVTPEKAKVSQMDRYNVKTMPQVAQPQRQNTRISPPCGREDGITSEICNPRQGLTSLGCCKSCTCG